VPQKPLPYGKQWISDEDIGSVVEVLRSEWLTTGPRSMSSRKRLPLWPGHERPSLSEWYGGVHCAMYALGIGPGDEVIVPAMTFARDRKLRGVSGRDASLCGCASEDLLLDPESVESRITPNTRAGDRCGLRRTSCDYAALRRVTEGGGSHSCGRLPCHRRFLPR